MASCTGRNPADIPLHGGMPVWRGFNTDACMRPNCGKRGGIFFNNISYGLSTGCSFLFALFPESSDKRKIIMIQVQQHDSRALQQDLILTFTLK